MKLKVWPVEHHLARRLLPRAYAWAAIGFLGSALAAPAAENAKLGQARTIYQTTLAKIEKACADKTQAWPGQYLAALKELQDRFQKAGNLEGWQAVDRETKRFQADRKVTKDSLVATPLPLRALQEPYMDIAAAYALQQNQEIVNLTQKYLQHLGDLQRELTIAGKMDDAIAVNTEMKTAKESAKFTAAEFAVADYEARKAAEKPATPEPPPAKPSTGEPDTPQPDPVAEPAPGSPTVIQVYADGKKPPALPGVDFKRLSLRPPKLSANPKNLVVAASLASVPDTTQKEFNLPRATVTSKEIKTKHYLRLTLRTPTGAQPLPNAVVAVQGFVTPVRNDPGKKPPQLLGMKQATLARLTEARG